MWVVSCSCTELVILQYIQYFLAKINVMDRWHEHKLIYPHLIGFPGRKEPLHGFSGFILWLLSLLFGFLLLFTLIITYQELLVIYPISLSENLFVDSTIIEKRPHLT